MPYYHIKSKLSLASLNNILYQYASSPQEVGFVRIIYDKDNKETDRSLCIISPQLYERLVKANLSQSGIDFYITPYNIKNPSLPGEGYSFNYYIPLPSNEKLKEEAVITSLKTKLDALIQLGDLPPHCYRITIPKKSRKSSQTQGTCFVSFNSSAREHHQVALALARIALNGSEWELEQELPSLRCYWAVVSKKKEGEKEQ